MDRRIKRTRRILSQSFLELLKERTFHEVSIRDITDHADVAYSTFFRNFESKEALLLHYLQNFLQMSKQEAQSKTPASYREKSRYMIYSLFVGVYQCPNIYRILYGTPETQSVLKVFKNEFIDMTLQMAQPVRFEPPVGVPANLIMDNAVNQLLGMIEWWIDNELRQSPDQMLQYYETIILEPTWNLLLGTKNALTFLDS